MSSSNGHTSSLSRIPLEYKHSSEEFLSIDELKRLIQMLDQSDIMELEVKSLGKQERLVLRKTHNTIQMATQSASAEISPVENDGLYTITASLVGIFHHWSISKERPLVAIGDRIKEGQHVGMIEVLHIPSEVESPVAGRVVEFLVADGQPVEYGQALIIIDQR
jgi:acetyl-CoA carboxylase biotin carboxyl carrier protein